MKGDLLTIWVDKLIGNVCQLTKKVAKLKKLHNIKPWGFFLPMSLCQQIDKNIKLQLSINFGVFSMSLEHITYLQSFWWRPYWNYVITSSWAIFVVDPVSGIDQYIQLLIPTSFCTCSMNFVYIKLMNKFSLAAILKLRNYKFLWCFRQCPCIKIWSQYKTAYLYQFLHL